MKALKYTKHFCFVFLFYANSGEENAKLCLSSRPNTGCQISSNHGLELFTLQLGIDRSHFLKNDRSHLLKNDRFVLKTKKLFFSISSSFRGRKVFLIFDDR